MDDHKPYCFDHGTYLCWEISSSCVHLGYTWRIDHSPWKLNIYLEHIFGFDDHFGSMSVKKKYSLLGNRMPFLIRSHRKVSSMQDAPEEIVKKTNKLELCIFFCGGHFIGWDGVSLPSIIEFTLDPRISFAKVTCHLKSFVRGMMSQGPCRRTNASRPWPVWRFEGGWECLPQTGVHSSGPGFPTRRRRISRRFIARRVVLVVELLVADAAWLPGRCFFFPLCSLSELVE